MSLIQRNLIILAFIEKVQTMKRCGSNCEKFFIEKLITLKAM